MLIGQLKALAVLLEQQESAERKRNGLLPISDAETEYTQPQSLQLGKR